MLDRVLGTIALLLLMVCADAHAMQPACDPASAPVAGQSLVPAADVVPDGALIRSETSLRLGVDRGTGQTDARRTVGRVQRLGATSALTAVSARRSVHQHVRFPSSSSLRQAGLPAWFTTTPPPLLQR
jgi:hypothetical protein